MASRRRHIGAQLSNAVYRSPEADTLFVLTAVGTAAAIAVMVALKAQNWPGQRRRRRDLTCSSSGSRISTATTALAAATSVASGGGGGGGDSGNSSGSPSSVGTSQQPAPVPPPTGELDSRFFADTDETGLARCSLRLLDRFLSWGCGRHLLGLGLFPDAKEITESMACLQAATEHLPETVRLADSDVVALVIGDGRTPRTAALLAMRSKWSVISIDPALAGLLPDSDTACAATAVGVLPPKELRSARLLEQEQAEGPAVRRRQLRADLRSIDRLHLCDAKVQDATVILSDSNSGSTATAAAATTAAAAAANDPATGPSIRLTLPHGGKVVVILPHAHVTPDEALTCLRFEGSFGTHPVALISLIQIPCCAYVYHNTCLGLQPNVEFLDPRICAIARCVRVWRDVSSQFDFAASERRAGVALGRRTRAARDSELQAAKRRAKRVHSEAREARRLKRQQRRGVVDGGPGGSRRPKLQPLVV